jgi:hypothetical protein
MKILNKIKLWVKIKRLFYRYNLKRKENKSTQQILSEMVDVYYKLPQEEQIIMRNKIQSIINTYGKE